MSTAAHSIWFWARSVLRGRSHACKVAGQHDLRLRALACKKLCPASTSPQCSLHIAPLESPAHSIQLDARCPTNVSALRASALHTLPAGHGASLGPRRLAA